MRGNTSLFDRLPIDLKFGAICEQVSLRAARAASELHAEAVDGFRVTAGRKDVDAILCLGDQWCRNRSYTRRGDAGKRCIRSFSPGLSEPIKLTI